MAEDRTNQDNLPSQGSSTGKTNSFVKGMIKDYSEIYIPEGVWTNAINAINTSHKGDEGNLGNEQSNKYCASSTYTIIGLLHKYRTEWVVYSTDNVFSEIGIFDEADCSYTALVNDMCLNFNTKYLITGAVKYNADCTYSAYWQDNNNPDRVMNLDPSRIPYICTPKLITIDKDFYNYTITRNEPLNPCGTGFAVDGEDAPSPPGYFSYDISLGEIYGLVTLTFDSRNVPDRYIVMFDGVPAIDTGYTGNADYDFGGSDRSTFIACLNGESDPVTNTPYPNFTQWPDDGYPRITSPGSGSATFMKASTTSIATLMVVAPCGDTVWDAELSCPDPNAPGVPPMPPIATGIYYINTDDETVQIPTLDYGESITVCALEDSVTGFPNNDYTLVQSSICDTISVTIPDPDACGAVDCTTDLDCDQLRLHPFVDQPCVTVNTAIGAGQLQNGSYQAVVAYSYNGIRLTDYSVPSTPQALWDHSSFGGSIDINITGLDPNFEEYELVVISVIANQTVAKKVGNYDISQTKVHLDQYLASLETIPLSLIPLRSQIYEKSKKMFSLNNYLIRTSVTTQPYFNYQPFANRIKVEWVAVQYPADYYWKGGNKTGYMRDEVYSFFIRWVYKTGAKSASYHIPGREALPSDLAILPLTNPDLINVGRNKRWQVYDTSTIAAFTGTLEDGGVVIAKGNMAYWESGDGSINPPYSGNLYPNNHPEIWGELCNKPIRHHKMPSNETIHIHDEIVDKLVINILGVQFSNIVHPVDNQGNPLTDISGYEILRGSREGNRSVVAKGLFNNMLEYDIPGSTAGTRKGMIQNYPYNDLRTDPFLASGITRLNDYFSFNSPETAFVKPYLGRGVYTRIYREQYGVATGAYEFPYKHPKFKVITDFAFGFSAFIGLGIALLSIMGKTSTSTNNTGQTRAWTTAWGALYGVGTEVRTIHLPVANFDNSVGMSTEGNIGSAATNLVGYIAQGLSNTGTTGLAAASTLATIASIAVTVGTGVFYFYEATSQMIEIFRKMIPYKNYVLQYNSHGFYNSHGNITNTNVPSGVQPSFNRTLTSGGVKYIGTGIQDFNATKRINNLFRGKYVCLNLTAGDTIPDITGPNADVSKIHVTPSSPFDIKNTNIASYYGALKLDYENQYGQLSSIVQIPTDSCIYFTEPELNTTHVTAPIFGGDVYINRYTDKNPYFFFNTWLVNEPDGTQFDYSNYINGPQPQYYANFEDYDIYKDFGFNIGFVYFTIDTPSDKFNWYGGTQGLTFSVNNSWMYLFNNGVKDFFVESELNMAFRDYGENDWEKFYDVYGNTFNDVSTMFRSDLITRPVFYKYDLSLSTAKLYNNFISWGLLLPADYDPVLYETCYEYFPYRGIYSLQQQDGLKRDNWRNFLPLNYYTFEGIVTNIKSVNASGALILYEDFSPSQFVGVDTLKTDTGGTKITIGDGGLFANNIQALVNAEDVIEYGASISNRATLNTPYGLFFVSQKAGKVIQYGAEGMNEISKSGMKNWFLQNLPSPLLEAFPNYTEYDNPVAGIAVQAIYDAQYELLYITKKDYKPLDCVGYDPNFGFYDTCYCGDCPPNYTLVDGICERNFDTSLCDDPRYTYNPDTGECERITTENAACDPPVPFNVYTFWYEALIGCVNYLTNFTQGTLQYAKCSWLNRFDNSGCNNDDVSRGIARYIYGNIAVGSLIYDGISTNPITTMNGNFVSNSDQTVITVAAGVVTAITNFNDIPPC
jgi:hypothetical protein